MSSLPLIPMVLAVFFLQFPPSAYSSTFTIRNKCSYPVWSGILSGAATPKLSTTGFPLQPGESTSLSVPASWSGRLWGCSLCTQDSSNKFPCSGKFPFPRPCFPCFPCFPCLGNFPPCPGNFPYFRNFHPCASNFPCLCFPCLGNFPFSVKFPAKTEPFPAETKPCSHVVHVLPRNRRLLGKLPDVNIHSPPSTANKKSWNLDKEDPPSPPAPRSNQPTHP